MPRGTEVGIGRGDIVLDGDAAPPQSGRARPILGPCLLRPNGWMPQDTIWCEGRPRLRQHCVTLGPSSPPKGHSPRFLAHVYCGQTVAHLGYC